jgi:hypothetical protein
MGKMNNQTAFLRFEIHSIANYSTQKWMEYSIPSAKLSVNYIYVLDFAFNE